MSNNFHESFLMCTVVLNVRTCMSIGPCDCLILHACPRHITYDVYSMLSYGFTLFPAVSTAPLDLMATNISTSGFNLEWNPPNSPNEIIDFYQVVLFADNNPDLPALNPVNVSGTSYTVTGLAPFTEYSVRVCAYTTECGDIANLSVTTLGGEKGQS